MLVIQLQHWQVNFELNCATWANICCELLLSAVCSINLFLCNLKLRHNSREWQKSWAGVPSVAGLPWPAWWCLPQYLACSCQSARDGIQCSKTHFQTPCWELHCFNSKQQHTEHTSTSLEMQIQGECAEFATKQRHLAYSHLESLQPRTFNAFWSQFWCLPSELNKYWQGQAQVWNQPSGWFLHHLLEHHQLQGPTLGARLTERLFHRDCNKLQRKSNMHSMLSCYVCMKKRQKYWSTSEVWRWLPYRLPPKNHSSPQQCLGASGVVGCNCNDCYTCVVYANTAVQLPFFTHTLSYFPY